MGTVKKRGQYKPKQNNEIKLSSYLKEKEKEVNKK
jgi:hypothetical protein